MSWESPIHIFEQQLQASLENEILTAVRKVHVEVDKEELLRALQYDREQYEKGYRDAVTDKDLVDVVRCEKCKHSLCDGWLCGGPDFTMPSHPTYPNSFCSAGERKTE